MERKKYVLIYSIISIIMVLFILNCSNKPESDSRVENNTDVKIVANTETMPVRAAVEDDAADDPAIWIDYNNPLNSLIIGTNKKSGLHVYDIEGNELFFIAEGEVNNVDLRYNFRLNDRIIDIAGGSNRSDNTVCLHLIDGKNRQLIPIHARKIYSGVDEVYGFCMYKSPVSGNHYAFVNGKDGNIEQYLLFATLDNKVDAELVRKLQVESQPEGMVADDESGILFVGEEEGGIWRFSAEPDSSSDKKYINGSGEDNSAIEFDIEGLAIYRKSDTEGYLIASSQGNNSFAVFQLYGDNGYITSFKISEGSVDSVEETDGIEVISHPIGDKFPEGLLVVQDGFNYEQEEKLSQNFKLVDWRQIGNLLSSNKTRE